MAKTSERIEESHEKVDQAAVLEVDDRGVGLPDFSRRSSLNEGLPNAADRSRRSSLPIISLWRSDEHAVPAPPSPQEAAAEKVGKDTPGLVRSLSQEPYTAFGKTQRRFIVALASSGSFWSPLTANIYFPSIVAISRDLDVSISAVNLTVTLYLIAQGLSPTLWGAIGDVLGRRIVYIACLIVYVAACAGLSVCHSYGLLLALRFIQACGSASTIALGAAVIGDVASPHERGALFGWYSISLQAGTAVGPVIGGIIADRLGWQAIFWVLGGGSGAVLVALILFLPETLRQIVGNGSKQAPRISRPLIPVLTSKGADVGSSEAAGSFQRRLRQIRPFDPIRLLFEPDVFCALIFNAVGYAVYTGSVVSLSSLLESEYGLNTLQIGLCYLPNGIGCVVGGPVSGWIMNHSFRRYAKHHVGKDGKVAASPKDIRDLSEFPIEHARLSTLLLTVPSFFISILLFGWLTKAHTQLAGPLIFQFFIGFSFLTTMNATSTLVIDLFPKKAASVTATSNLCRCLLGAAITAAMQPLLDALGAGWSFTVLCAINAAALPLVWLEWTQGYRWRTRRRERLEKLAEQRPGA